MTDPQTVGFMSDIHANSVALRAVLDDMPDVEELVCLGDVIGYGPKPGEVVELVQEHADTVLYGNHEMYLDDPAQCQGNRGAFEGIIHALDTLSDEQLAWAQELSYHSKVGDDVRIVHGHPDPSNPFQYIKKGNATNLVPHSREHGWGYLAAGHSHLQFQLDLGKFHDEAGVVFNPGSVGQPRDNDPRAAYAVLDRESGELSMQRVEYDVERVVNQIEDAGLPEKSAARLREGRMPKKHRRNLRF